MRRTNDIVSQRDFQSAELPGSFNRFENLDDDGARLWAPPVDVAETDSEIVLYAELPGMTREDIDISLQGDTLVMRGERQFAQNTAGEHFHRIERHYGPWRRAFQIEVPVDVAMVSATYENGVLTVRLPKKNEPQTRQIQIEIR